jgi:hypothetical protein
MKMIEEIKKRIMPGRVINIGMETTQQDSNYILWLYREHERLSSRLEIAQKVLEEIVDEDSETLSPDASYITSLGKRALDQLKE